MGKIELQLNQFPWWRRFTFWIVCLFDILHSLLTHATHAGETKMKTHKRKWHKIAEKEPKWRRYWECDWCPWVRAVARIKYVFIVISCITTIRFNKFLEAVVRRPTTIFSGTSSEIWLSDDLWKFQSTFAILKWLL